MFLDQVHGEVFSQIQYCLDTISFVIETNDSITFVFARYNFFMGERELLRTTMTSQNFN